MQQERRTLSIKARPAEEPLDPAETLRRAIVRRLCATATYNKTQVKFAPHILYTRHDDPFVDAQVIERDGKPPREVKLGVFKVAGLKDVKLTDTPFFPLPDFKAEGELYDGTTLQAVRAPVD